MIRVSFFLLFACSFAAATEHINFVEFKAEKAGTGMDVTMEPVPLLDYEQIRDDRYFLHKRSLDYNLDAVFRQTAFLMRTLERNRGTLITDSELPVISYLFQFGVRKTDGTPVDVSEYKVTIGLTAEEDKGFIRTESGKEHFFQPSTLTDTAMFNTFVTNIVFPQSKQRLALPDGDGYIIDVYFRWPRVEVDKDQFNVFDLFPSGILWNKGFIRDIWMSLGATYCWVDESGALKQVRSRHLHAFKDSVEKYEAYLKAVDKGDLEEQIVLLEEYVALVPNDRKALKNLMDAYIEFGMDDEAFDLILRFQPFFATIREGLDNRNQLAVRAERRRNRLLGRKAQFKRDKGVKLRISSPVDGDLITGTTDLEFQLVDNGSPLLEVEAWLDEQLISRMEEPPFRTKFTVAGTMGDLKLRVRAYFENETYQEDVITVSSLKVDEEQKVNLVPLHASVFTVRGDGDQEYTADDFLIRENGEKRKVEHFRKSTAPLRIAVVIDTSVSMFGEKLYHAQYALKTFVDKLQPEDRVAIYTFSDRVLKMQDFSNKFEQIEQNLLTFTPLGATSLYDAMLIANDALEGQNGTKIMIVLSDGDDSSSTTTDIHVAGMLRRGPVMVYPIILPGGVISDGDRGEIFLKQMANLSGSIFTKVSKTKNLDEKFAQIYEDFKSFYYLDYYSTFARPEDREIDVKLKSSGKKLRIRALR